MRRRDRIHLILALLVNFLIIAKVIDFYWIGNDKAILVVIFYYFILIVVNILSWVILESYKQPAWKIYKITTAILVILIIPILLISFIH